MSHPARSMSRVGRRFTECREEHAAFCVRRELVDPEDGPISH
jgi:hypothetical protein